MCAVISLDMRAGSADYLPLLRRLGLPVQPAHLAYGDLKFLGVGPGGAPATVGVEIKTVRDLLACMCDGRFAGHQLPGLVTAYDQPWLLVVGAWRAQRATGMLQYLGRDYRWKDAHIGSRKFLWRDLESWILTMRTKTGVLAVEMPDSEHAALWLATLYAWWTRPGKTEREGAGYDTHRSHLAVNEASNEQFWQRVKSEERETRARNGSGGVRGRLADPACLMRPSVLRLVAAQLPGVGYARSEAIAKMFPTIAQLTAAGEKEIAECEGIGKLGAKRIWKAIHRG
jgi:ERCC4-type nuclease